MPRIVYLNADGSETIAQAKIGSTLMQTAIDHGVSGIVAECGGACQCATCHVYVAEEWLARLPAIGAGEEAMLDNTLAERRSNSRLSCEIEITAEHDGLVVQLPERQI